MGGVRDSYRFRRQRRDLVRGLGVEVRRLREDSGLAIATTSRAAGIDPSHLLLIEQGEREPSLSTLLGLGDVLGADLAVRLYPTTGPRLHGRLQAPMLESLLSELSNRWIPNLETAVYRPARGVIDLVLVDRSSPSSWRPRRTVSFVVSSSWCDGTAEGGLADVQSASATDGAGRRS